MPAPDALSEELQPNSGCVLSPALLREDSLSDTPRAAYLIVVASLLSASAVAAQQIDTSHAMAALRDARAACTADDGRLWGRSLCGPIALVDRQSRLVIANDTASGARYLPFGEAYVTTLPPSQFIANTSFRWGDREWTMVAMPLPADRYARTALVLHEVFHREQAALGLRRPDALNNHLDFREGRTWLRLELRALAAALTAGDAAARRHTRDALLFRDYRRSLYPGSDTLETLLEIQEGLPEYTGHLLAMQVTSEGLERPAMHVSSFERSRATFVRAFAYGTGPALGLLLDRFTPEWRKALRERADLTALLSRGVGYRAPRDLERQARARAAAYGWNEVDREEAARDSAREPRMREYRERFVESPTLRLEQSRDSLSWGFDPNALIAFDLTSAVYPFGTFTAPWGTLQVTERGVLVRNDLTMLRVGIAGVDVAGESGELAGDGWTLRLNPGWVVRPDPERPGSYVLMRGV